jgi:hypothetical protein
MSNDGSLNIVTKVSGQAELNALFEKFQNGTISINEMTRAIKLNNDVYKNAPNVHNAFGAAVARNTVILQDAKDKAVNPLTSANGRMMHSYFQSGEALRIQTLFANGLSKGFQSLGMSTEKATSISDAFAGSIGLMVGVVGVVIGAIMGLKKAFEMAMVATRMALLQSTMQQMAKEDGVNFAKVMQDITDKIGGSVSHNKILQGITDLQMLGVEWKEMPRIMEFAEMRSKMLGTSFDEVFQTMERASMGNKKAIRSLKMDVDIEQSYKDFAKTIGVTADELSEAGKKHSLFEAILKTGEEQHKKLDKALVEELEKYEQLETAWANLGEKGGKLATELTPLVKQLAAILESLNNIANAKWGILWENLKANTFGNSGDREARLALKDTQGVLPPSMSLPPGYNETKVDNSKYIDQEKVAAKRKKAIEDDVKLHKETVDTIYKQWEVSKELSDEEAKRLGVQKISTDNAIEQLEKQMALQKTGAERYETYKKIIAIQKDTVKTSDDEVKNQAKLAVILAENNILDEETVNKSVALLRNLEDQTDSALIQAEIEKQICSLLDKQSTARERNLKEQEDLIRVSGTFNQRMKLWWKETKQQFETTTILADGLQNAISDIGSRWAAVIPDLLSGTQNIGQAFTTMQKAVVAALGEIIAKMIAMKILQAALGIFGLAGGGDVTSDGGSLSGVGTPSVSMAASGGDFAYGSAQNVLVGEKGMELMQVGRNGVRIISNNNLQKMNQMSQSSRGGNGNAAMAKAFQSLADKITPASASEVHYAMIKQSKIRSGRIM